MDKFPIVQYMSTFQPINAKAPKAAFAEGAWGFILTLPSQTLYEYYYKYELALYVDGVYIGVASGQQDTEGTNLILTVIYSSAPKESLRFVVRKVGQYICEGDLEIGLMNLTSTLLPCSDSIVEGMQVRFHLKLDAKMVVTSPGTGSYVSEVVTLKNTVSPVTMPRVITVTSTATGAQVGYIYVQLRNYSWYCVATSSSMNGLNLAYNKVILKSIEVVSEAPTEPEHPTAPGYLIFDIRDNPNYAMYMGETATWNDVMDSYWNATLDGGDCWLEMTTPDTNVSVTPSHISSNGYLLYFDVSTFDGVNVKESTIESVDFNDISSPTCSRVTYSDPLGGTLFGEQIAKTGMYGVVDDGCNGIVFKIPPTV